MTADEGAEAAAEAAPAAPEAASPPSPPSPSLPPSLTLPRPVLDDWGRQVLELAQLARRARPLLLSAATGAPDAVREGNAWAEDLRARAETLLVELAQAGVDTGASGS